MIPPLLLHSSSEPRPVTRKELGACTLLGAAFTAFSGLIIVPAMNEDVDKIHRSPTVQMARTLQDEWNVTTRQQWRALPPQEEIEVTTDHVERARTAVHVMTFIGGFSTLAMGLLWRAERKRDEDDEPPEDKPQGKGPRNPEPERPDALKVTWNPA